MKIARAFEKRNWGGDKPSWRLAAPVFNNLNRAPCVARSIRVMSNRQTKKLGLIFGSVFTKDTA